MALNITKELTALELLCVSDLREKYTDLFREISEQGGNTTVVGAYKDGISGYGGYDMAGNLWSWCDSTITATNGAEKGKRVNEIRGGSWYATSRSCVGVAIGEGRVGEGAYNTVGFRLALISQLR